MLVKTLPLLAVALGLVLAECEAQNTCISPKSCEVQKKLKPGKWWRKELNEAQPKCKAIDPENRGTCHQWTVDLSPNAMNAVNDIKEALAEHINIVADVSKNHRVLAWNDPMDELYLSAPKNTEGSDRVFITPHIDGFLGFIPSFRAWRCVYGLTGPHNTVTFQPMRNPDEREVILGPGKFTCFDFNREIHWIEHQLNTTMHLADERMVLKLHFYEYPAIVPSWIGDMFGNMNAQYNFFARRAFLVSQFPERSVFARLVARAINFITIFGGRLETHFGFVNAGIVFAFIMAAHFRKYDLLSTAATAHYGIYLLAYVFRSVTLGMFTRDAMALKSVSLLLLGVSYLSECVRSGFSWLSFLVAAAGFSLSTYAFLVLGADNTYFGRELGVVHDSPVTAWPYGGSFAVPHPMILGSVLGLVGLRMHPSFGPKFSRNFLLHCACYAAVVAVEVFDIHLPSTMTYSNTFEEFEQFHQVEGNVLAHLFTTALGVIGILGLVNNFLYPSSTKGSSNTGKESSSTFTNAPLVTLAWTWLIVRYAVPDWDVANLSVLTMSIFSMLVWTFKPSSSVCALLLALSVGLQEYAHYYFNEVTYMASYAELTPKAALTFIMHNVWLLPFEIRAAINTLSPEVTPLAHTA